MSSLPTSSSGPSATNKSKTFRPATLATNFLSEEVVLELPEAEEAAETPELPPRYLHHQDGQPILPRPLDEEEEAIQRRRQLRRASSAERARLAADEVITNDIRARALSEIEAYAGMPSLSQAFLPVFHSAVVTEVTKGIPYEEARLNTLAMMIDHGRENGSSTDVELFLEFEEKEHYRKGGPTTAFR